MASITIKDIAKDLRVNVATVSRALNDQPGVSDAVRQTIKSRAIEMGYRPNALARRLVTNRGSTIAYLAPDLGNPFHVEVAHAIKTYFHARGYTLILCDSKWDVKAEAGYLEYMERQRIDGLILKSASSDFSYIASVVSCPVAMLSTARSDHFPTIDTDNFYGGFLATEALIRSGYKRIAYLGAKQDIPTSSHRGGGYKAALRRYGLPYRKGLVGEGNYTLESGREFMSRMWRRSERPDAVFCINDDCAIGAMDFMVRQGVKIPDDFGVIGFDDMFMASLALIELSTVAQQGRELGTGAAELLLKAIKGETPEKFEHCVIEPRLVLRKTTRSIEAYRPTSIEEFRASGIIQHDCGKFF